MSSKKSYEDLVLQHGPHQTFRPVIYTPITRLTEHWFSHATGRCGKYENILFQCGMQGSKDQMYKRCVREMEDLEECLHQFKQIARYKAIQKERRKQRKFEEPPAQGIYLHEPSPYTKIGNEYY